MPLEQGIYALKPCWGGGGGAKKGGRKTQT